MKYYKGRNNLACTIFVPFKCGNNCNFCNTNEMYNNYVYCDDYLNSILQSINICNNSDNINEFVITGGEPFMNLDILKTIINAINKPIYINTSLPITDNIDEYITYINTEDKIKGINISRHIGTVHNVKTASLEYINKIEKYIRINCIIKENMLNDKLFDFINMYANPYRMINFRADYRNITLDTLKNRDKISEWMLTNFLWEGANQCLVCNSEFYSDDKSIVICYHRGLEHSSVTYKDRCYVNDVIIDIYGNIYKDWDMKQDNKFIKFLINENIN